MATLYAGLGPLSGWLASGGTSVPSTPSIPPCCYLRILLPPPATHLAPPSPCPPHHTPPHPTRHTKLVTLKPKYIIENQTGVPVAVKQLGTRDPLRDPPAPELDLATNPRFARVLLPNQR